MNDPVAEALHERFAKLYHAVQLRDFEAYCGQKAVLSRHRLTNVCSDYTPFYTDKLDKKHGVWARTFGNPQDFGSLFWFVDKMIPNLYGPITLTFDRSIWKTCNDVALATTNPGDDNYDLDKDRLSADAVKSCYVKNGKYWKLKTYGLELSVGNDQLPFSKVSTITVEPVNDQLLNQVRQLWKSAGCNPAIVKARNLAHSNATREKQFKLLVDWATSEAGELPVYSELPSVVPVPLETWFNQLRNTLHPPLRQWLEYTYYGTIQRMVP